MLPLPCEGQLVSNKCYFYVVTEGAGDYHDFADYVADCRQMGGHLPGIKTEHDHTVFAEIVRCEQVTGMVYGDSTVPNIYRHMWTGVDRTVYYDVHPIIYTAFNDFVWGPLIGEKYYVLKKYGRLNRVGYSIVYDLNSVHRPTCGVLCERYVSDSPQLKKINFPRVSLTTTTARQRPVYVRCEKGHVTHQFLHCDPRSQCSHGTDVEWCMTKTATPVLFVDKQNASICILASPDSQLFECDNGDKIMNTLVCDFRYDCRDGSDERFCDHLACPEFNCADGQCLSFSARCDRSVDCIDGSDEADCDSYAKGYTNADVQVFTPALIQFNRFGFFTHEVIEYTNDSCPETHYWCTSQDFCLPVFTRCNGYYDCLDREDEFDCEHFVCPGFYCCLDSSACLHPDHLCDGWPQCPQRDDEWLCEEQPCPDACLCRGLSFTCSQPFNPRHFPQLRALDGRGSGMTPDHVSSNVYLIYLTLSRCALQQVSGMLLPNLRHLDLSFNQLRDVSMSAFLTLGNLKTVSMAHNPLEHLYRGTGLTKQRSLLHVDLSFTELLQFNSQAFSNFPTLQLLNLSHTTLLSVSEDGFRHVPTLVDLDMTASPLQAFPLDVFQGVSSLKRIVSDNYRLCCRDVLPDYFKEHGCVTPRNEISSCQDLLRSDFYRACLWIICCLSVAGNVFSLVFRACVQRKAAKSAFNVFVSSLGMADLVMGVYIAFIGVADWSFRGHYLQYELTWQHSVTCQVAGFLSFLSKEVSALAILLITLDRFIVLRFPFSTRRFGKRSATAVCCMAWLSGLALAAVPLLPVTSHWQFYSQTGICIPLPVSRQEFEGRSYSVGILIVFNFVLFVLIGAGQAFIYWSVQQNAIAANTTRQTQDATIARRLITVAVTDFLCWFPIGLCWLLALSGVAVPGEVYVAMATFVLPLNSALNPFLYTFNVVMEKQRKRQEDKVIKDLESKFSTGYNLRRN